MASPLSVTRGFSVRRGPLARTLATLVGILAILGALTAGVASAEVVPSGGDFQSTPPTWSATALSGNLNTVSASQASTGTNRFYRTQYTTPANLLGSSLANMAATEGITSPTFTWIEGSPQALVASFDSGVQFSGLLGVDANAGIGMYLQNETTNTETLLASRRLTQNSADFSTVSAAVSPSLLITGDTYRVQVRETFAPTVQAAGSTTIDLDNVDLTETPATPPPPTLAAGSASIVNVTSSSATASATIDPGSANTTVQVDYGTTTAYGSSTGTQTIPANSGATPVSIALSGLSPSTTYHAQITATNAGGPVSSADLTFTTPAPSPTPAPTVGPGGAQGTPGERAATVGTTIDDAGAGSSYYVQYGTSTSYVSSTSPQGDPSGVSGSTSVATALTGLQPGTTYHARYVVTSPGGTTLGNDFTFTTAAASPPTVGSPSASTTSTDGTQQTVSAVVNPGANDTQVSVSYGASSSYGSTTSAVLVPGGTSPQTVSIPINGLTPGNTYHYTVTATNADGTVGTADATFSPAAQTSPPVGATSATAGPDEHSVTLAATIDTGGSGGSYVVQYGSSTAYGGQTASQALTATSGGQALSGSLSGLAPGTTYHARFVAMVDGHPDSDGADFQFSTAPASPPTIATSGPSATTASADGTRETISTSVNPGTHDTTVSVDYGTTTGYGATATASSVLAAGSGATNVSIPLAGLTPGATYHYRVNATNVDGATHTVDATFAPMATDHPPMGTTSTAQGPGTSSATLDSSVDTGGNGGTYYLQYGTGTDYGSRTESAVLSAAAGAQPLTASLSGLAPGTTYHVRFVVLVNGYPVTYGSDFTFTTASGSGTGSGSSTGSGSGSGSGGGAGTGSGTGGAGTGSSTGSACVAAYVTASARTLRMLSFPAGAQLTARRGLRVALQRRVRTTGTPTFQIAGGRRTRIRGRAFTITRSQLRAGRTSTVRVVIPQRPRAVSVSLRIGATGCGIQLTSVASARSLQLRLRLPLGAHRVALTLPRAMASPTVITITTSTGTRSLSLTGRGRRLRVRRAAGAPRVSARGTTIMVTGLPATATGVSLRFPATRAKGSVTARVDQRSGGSASARLGVGRRAPGTHRSR